MKVRRFTWSTVHRLRPAPSRAPEFINDCGTGLPVSTEQPGLTDSIVALAYLLLYQSHANRADQRDQHDPHKQLDDVAHRGTG